MSRRTTVIAVAVAAIAVGVVLGVTLSGGGGPTKAQFVARADSICKTAKSQTTPLIKEIIAAAGSAVTGGSAGVKKLATLVERLRAEAAADLARLRAIAQPKSDRAAIERFLKPLASVVDVMGKAASALHAGQPLQALALFQQAQPTAAQVTSAAQAYGTRECSQLLSALG